MAPVLGLLVALAPGPARAADAEELGWSDTAEFSYVATAGNSESQTLGFKNKLWRAWEKSRVEFNAGGIRTESTVFTRFAVGTTGDFDDDEIKFDEVTAENYFLNGRYDRKISDRFFWFAGAGWDRNEFAGIRDRYTGFGGVGNIWVDNEKVKFRTDYAVTYTKQDDVIEDPDFDDTFGGARFSWAYLHHFGENTTYGNDLVLQANLEESDDWRGDMINWVAVAMSSKLALKLSLQWLYDNQPALEEVPLFATNDTSLPSIGTVLIELDELDTIFTASLVANF
jgi:putative salt-induced outer membrane protein YdiY